MSRFLERIIHVCPPFRGSHDEVMKNYDSHTWRVVDMDQRFSIRGIGTFVECEECKIIADTEYAKYKCGEAPESIPYDVYMKQINSRST